MGDLVQFRSRDPEAPPPYIEQIRRALYLRGDLQYAAKLSIQASSYVPREVLGAELARWVTPAWRNALMQYFEAKYRLTK